MLTRHPPLILVAALCSGCSLILDTGDLPQQPDAPPGAPDADPPDAIPIDANFLDFAIDSADLPELIEGAGAKGMPVVIRFYGMNIVEPTVTAAWSDGFADPIAVVSYHASNTYDEVAVELRVPVRDTLDEGACNGVSIHFDFTQAGAAMDDELDVPLRCLDELTSLADYDPGKTYARIDLITVHHFPTGDANRVVLRAVEDIRLGPLALIDVDAVNQSAGAGAGCNGGDIGGASGCTGGGAAGAGGMALSHGGGGGGGGYFTTGTSGVGGATGGGMHGSAMLVPLGMAGNDGNHGSGGGGGGQVLLGNAGEGGGGGGTIQLVAGGEIVVWPGAMIRARGGAGQPGSGNALTGSGGGGGGGGGGAIFVRAGAGIRFEGIAIPWLWAPGGPAGAAPLNAGGNGAEGRVRVDQPVATPAAADMIGAGGKAAGPIWEPTTPTLVTTPTVIAKLRGQAGPAYGVILNGDPIANGNNGNVALVGGAADVTIDGLVRGHNTICALYASIGAPYTDRDEARSCIDVVYVPASP